MKILKKPSISRTDSNLTILINIALTDGEEAEKFVESLEECEYRLSASRYRRKRSLNANAFLWTMCEKIADRLRMPKTDIYRHAIKEVGVFHDMAVAAKDLYEVQRIWESNGIGWFTESFDSRLENCVRVRFYHGSSLYDTKQMSRLIDYIVDEAHALGIETETEENIRRMIESWSKE